MIQLQVMRSRTEPERFSLDHLDRLIDDPDSLVWIDVSDPTPDDFEVLAREFRFHPLALEDAHKRHQRPKLDQYDDFLFIVFYAVRPTTDDRLFSIQELSLFVGANFLVTIHVGPCHEVEETARRWQEFSRLLGDKHVAVLLYSLLDTIVDSYFPVLDQVSDRTDELEQAIFDGANQEALGQIFVLRKQLLSLRRVLAPERDLMSTLTRRDIELLGTATAPYFQDIYDHVLRVTDAVDTYRDLLAGALDVYLSAVSNNLNQVMRTLTAWSIILMSLALIASVYGMNFDYMPELGLRFGYPLVLLGMVVLASVLLFIFKRSRWL